MGCSFPAAGNWPTGRLGGRIGGPFVTKTCANIPQMAFGQLKATCCGGESKQHKSPSIALCSHSFDWCDCHGARRQCPHLFTNVGLSPWRLIIFFFLHVTNQWVENSLKANLFSLELACPSSLALNGLPSCFGAEGTGQPRRLNPCIFSHTA